MQRRLNPTPLFWALASLAVLGTVVHLVHSAQMYRNAGVLLRQAERALERNDYGQAASLFGYYLDYQPEDTDVIARYAVALEKSSPSSQVKFKAFLLSERVLRRQPERDDVRRRAAQLAIDVGRCDDGIRHLEYLLKTANDKATLLQKLGWCQQATGQNRASADSFRRAIALAPGQVDSYVFLAQLLWQRLQQPAEAAKVMDSLVTANPQSWQALLARAHYRFGRGQSDRAEADVVAAYQLAPQQKEVILAAAEMALLQGNLTSARTHVPRGMEVYPKNEYLYRGLAALETRFQHLPEAEACLRRGLKELPNSVGLRVQLAEVLLEMDQTDEVKALVSWLQGHGAQGGLVDYLQGRLLTYSGRWQEAADKLTSARAQLGAGSDWQANLSMSLGQCYERLGESELQLLAYRDAVVARGSNVAGRLGLAKALLLCHLAEDAVNELRYLTSLDPPPPEAWRLLVRALVEQYQRVAVAAPALQELEMLLTKAAAATPQAPDLPCLSAEVAMLSGEPAKALALLRTTLQEHPQNVEVWTTLIAILGRQNKTADAQEALVQAHRQIGARLELDRAALQLWSDKTSPAARAGLAQLARDPGPPGTTKALLRFYRDLADALLRLDERPEAESVLRKLAQRAPDDLRCRMLLFDLALEDDRDADAVKVLAQVHEIEGDKGILWRAGEAVRYIHQAQKGDKSKLPLARQRLAEIRERKRDWGRAVLLEAYVDDLDGQVQRAIEEYRRAIDLGERPPLVVLRVARWLSGRQRYAEADRVIRLAEEQSPLTRDLARLGAEAAVYNRDPKRAASLALKAVPAQSRDYRDLLWQGNLLWLAAQPSEAETALRHAVEVAPRVPDVWIALVQYLRRTRQFVQIDAAFEEMCAKLPADRLAVTTARCWEAVGQTEKAEQAFLAALSEAPEDLVLMRQVADFFLRADQFAKAEPYLLKLASATDTAPDLQEWARRQLALSLARAGPQDAARAMTWLDQNKTPTGWKVEDERARALILSTRPESRAAAVKLFEQTLASQPLTADEQFLLVHVYNANREFAKARVQMLLLLSFHRDNAQYLACHIRTSLQRGELDDARFYIQALELVEPQRQRTLELREQFRAKH
ncbi:MAG TPA: tetratricopeptide repeat protein [Gemmataceae bacterium]|nr:tetratricopeptide repeat protein [Gemmataceae bacterium]